MGFLSVVTATFAGQAKAQTFEAGNIYAPAGVGPSGAWTFTPHAIDNYGIVLGDASEAGEDGTFTTRAYEADFGGTARRADYVRRTRGEWNSVSAILGVSPSARFRVGYANFDRPELRATFTLGIGTMSLGVLPGDAWSQALDVSDSGVVVGTSHRADGVTQGFYTRYFAMRPLPARGGARVTVPHAINNGGLIVGESDGHPWIWFEGTGADLMPFMPERADACRIKDINNTWTMLVECFFDDGPFNTTYRSYLWPWAGTLMQVGPSRGGTRLAAINEHGCAIGTSGVSAVGGLRGYWYCGGNFEPLTDLLPQGWVVFDAIDINDNNEIVISARNGFGPVDTYILRPR